MKVFLTCCIFAFIATTTHAQAIGDILKQQAAQGAKEGATIAATKAGEKITDKLIGKLFDKKKKPNTDTESTKNPQSSNPTPNAAVANNNSTAEKATLNTYSKFDFIPGDKVLAYDDFLKDAIGDYPATWNTNSSGEIVSSSAKEGHWLQLSKQGKFIPEYIKSLPENFTFEYDLLYNDKYSYYSPALSLYFLTGKNDKEAFSNSFIGEGKRSGVKISFHPTNGSNNGGLVNAESFEGGQSIMKNEVNSVQFLHSTGKGERSVHVSIWRQNRRIRVYINEEKVFDLPRAFPDNQTYTTTLFEIWGDMKDQDRVLIDDLKLAAGAPDTRNKLISDGKFVTSGILFDVNSDRIKPESYGVLKDIAGVLTENISVKVRITGHTDSDGNAAENLSLSKRRAESVKSALVTMFNIDGARIESDGKGASQPVDSNSTPEGKANNRRVEFVKL